MKFLALLATLLLEQMRPLEEGNRLQRWLADYTRAIERYFNGGEYRHGLTAWVVLVASIVAATAVVFQVLHAMSGVLALLWSIAVLYVTLGFRQFSQHFTEIQQALRTGDITGAREWLAKWRSEGAAELEASEIARVAIERGLLASHRQILGAMAWFVALGPAGAVLYRLATLLDEEWGRSADGEAESFGRFAAQAFYWIDWVPARLTAASLAVVGNFEDAVYCWRMQAYVWHPRSDGVILASGAGALGIRLGGRIHGSGGLEARPEVGTGSMADAEHMPSAAGLIWKGLVLWMFVILVISVAHALG